MSTRPWIPHVYFALLNTGAWPIVRQQLQAVLEELIRRECKAEIAKLKTANSDVPVDLFVHYSQPGFLCGFDLVDGPPQPLNTVANRRRIPFFGTPNGTRRSW